MSAPSVDQVPTFFGEPTTRPLPTRRDPAAWGRRTLVSEGGIVAVVLWLLLLQLLRTAITLSWDQPPYPPDAFSYYELSRSFPGDPMRLHLFRSFVSTDPYSAAFPPLWPLSIAVVDGITGTALNAQQLASGIYAVVAAALLDRAGYRWFRRWGLGAATLLALSIFTPAIQELASGTPLMLTVCLLAGIVLTASGPGPLTDGAVTTIGVLGGLLLLTRFDAVGFVVLVPLLLVGLRLARPPQLKRMYLSTLIAVSPWILYSLIRFRRPWASDGVGPALAVPRTSASDVWPDGVPTLKDDPGAWFQRVRSQVDGVRESSTSVLNDARLPMLLLLALVVVIAAAVALDLTRPEGDPDGPGGLTGSATTTLRAVASGPAVRLLLPLAALAYATTAVTLAVTGSSPTRSLTPSLLLLELALLAAILSVPRRVAMLAPAACVVVALALTTLRLLSFSGDRPFIAGEPFRHATATPFDEVIQLGRCVGPDDRILFLRGAGEAYVFGAITNGTALVEPTNWTRLDQGQRQRFVTTYGATHLYLAPGGVPATGDRLTAAREFAASIGQGPDAVTEVCRAGLYSIRRPA